MNKLKWEYQETTETGGKLYVKGEKKLLIFHWRVYLWTNGHDAIIKERNV